MVSYGLSPLFRKEKKAVKQSEPRTNHAKAELHGNVEVLKKKVKENN
jgi:hypothetical protein